MAQCRLQALQRNKRPAYLLVEWESEEEKGDHSIIEGKLVHLQDRASGFVAGAKVECRLKEGTYPATIITAGSRAECYSSQMEREKEMEEDVQETGSRAECYSSQMEREKKMEEDVQETGVSDELVENKDKDKGTERPETPSDSNSEVKDHPHHAKKPKPLKGKEPAGKGPKSKKKLSAKAMEISSVEMSQDILEELGSEDAAECAPLNNSTPKKPKTSPDKVSTKMDAQREEEAQGQLKRGDSWPMTGDGFTPPAAKRFHGGSYFPPEYTWPRFPVGPMGPSSPSVPWYSSDASPPVREEDEMSMSSSYSRSISNVDPGLKDLVMNIGMQTQTAIASMQSFLQNINNEVISLRELLRRHGLRKRKSDERETVHQDTQAQDGMVFGDPNGSSRHKVILQNVSAGKVTELERLNDTPEKLSLALLLLLFSNEEISTGNCSKPMRQDISQLDPERLWAIKCHIDYVFPVVTELEGREGEVDKERKIIKRWSTIIQRVLNPKCRQLRIKRQMS